MDEIRAADPEIRVVDRRRLDRRTAAEAVRAGGDVVRLPFNLGIGGAMQTGYQYARDHGFDLRCRSTATASTTRASSRS